MQIPLMDAGELAGEIEAETVTGNIFPHPSAVKPLENMLADFGRNGPFRRIAHREPHLAVLFLRSDSDAATRPVILPRILL